MHSRELKQQMIEGTLPRIMNLAIALYMDTTARLKTLVGDKSALRIILGLDNPLQESEIPFNEQVMAEIRQVWFPMLSTFAFRLIRSAMVLTTYRIFIASNQNIAAAIAGVDLEALANGTGIDRKDVPFVLTQMAESLLTIIREHGTIEIDQQRFRLWKEIGQ